MYGAVTTCTSLSRPLPLFPCPATTGLAAGSLRSSLGLAGLGGNTGEPDAESGVDRNLTCHEAIMWIGHVVNAFIFIGHDNSSLRGLISFPPCFPTLNRFGGRVGVRVRGCVRCWGHRDHLDLLPPNHRPLRGGVVEARALSAPVPRTPR